VTRVLAVLAAALFALAIPAELFAQATELARQTLGRAYWHVFIAYALAILFIGGWVVSIARRLARVERRLDGE
jgi:CcmD family protein